MDYDLLDDLVVDLAFNPHEPRDARGRWTKGGGIVRSTSDDEMMRSILGMLGPDGLRGLRPSSPKDIEAMRKRVVKHVNQWPAMTAQLPDGWEPVKAEDLDKVFPDDPSRTADFLQGLDPSLNPAALGSVVVRKGTTVVQVDLPLEADGWAKGKPINPQLKDALDSYAAGIGRVATGAEWASNAVSKSPGAGKKPILTTIPSPGAWAQSMYSQGESDPTGGGILAFTRLDAPDYITMNPYILMQPEDDQTDAIKEGWFAPAAMSAPNSEGYTILHEFGHVNDARQGDTTGTPLLAVSAEGATPQAAALYDKHKAGADKYGSSMVFEMYAEAFAQFYGATPVAPGVPGVHHAKSRPRGPQYPEKVRLAMTEAATDYAKNYGWTR